MKILVTGSSGTIGTRLCERLLERGEDVIGVDWEPNKWQPRVEAITTHIDLRDEHALQAAADKLQADVIVHLAANARVYELVEHPDRARDNFLTIFNTLEFARKNCIKGFLFASSRECYGNSSATHYTEDMARMENCESPYTASKIAGEALVEAYTRCYGIDHVIFRFSNVYGMYDDSVRVVPNFIRLARKNEPLVIFGKDKCLDFTFIDDAVTGIIATIDRFDASKNDTYNIAFGEGTTLTHLAKRVIEILNSSSTLSIESSRTGEVIRYVADIAKAKKMLGYDPKISFDEGIEKSVEWYAKNMN